MTSGTAVLIGVVIVAIGVAAWALIQRQKTRRLRTKYGPEYDRLANRENSAKRAESILEEREKRVAKFQIHSLRDDERERFAAEWRRVQEKFVDDPRGAVSDADCLINEALRTRGYPMSDFEQRAADLSVDHPHVVENYRHAHEIAIADQQSGVTTEDLRQAMQYYRSLFEDVLETKITTHVEHLEVRHG